MSLLQSTTRATPIRPAVRLSDLLWVLARRHRAAIVVTLTAVVVLAGGLLVMAHLLSGIGRCADGSFPNSIECIRIAGHAGTGRVWLSALAVSPVVLGAFAGAPMFAREFERGTYVLTATSDVSPRRWFCAQVATLLGCSALLAVGLVFAAGPLRDQEALGRGLTGYGNQWEWVFWGSSWLLVPYAVSACAIGLLLSALVRRTLPALALTAIIVAALRVGAVHVVRPHWWSPMRAYSTLESNPQVDLHVLILTNDSYANTRGQAVSPPLTCFDAVAASATDQTYQCLRRHAVSQRVTIYQPADRRIPFEFAEGGAFVLIALGSVAGASRLMRRDAPT
jgi:hypothetical protein